MMHRRGPHTHEITVLLQRYGDGEAHCLDDVFALVYDELNLIARRQLDRSGVGRNVETSALVNEAYEKLVRGKTQRLQDRRHFFAVASRAMRQIVVDMYRTAQTAKRNADVVSITQAGSQLLELEDPEQIIAINQALEKLAEHSQDLVDTLDMACFAGLTNEQIAELTGCTVRTVQRKLQRARSWLVHFMGEG